VVRDELGGLAAAVEISAKAVKQWAGGWTQYEKLLAKRTSDALDNAPDRSPHYPRGALAALDLSIQRCPPYSHERALLEGAAVFAPEALPLDWCLVAAGLTLDRIEQRRAVATLEGLGLLHADNEAHAVTIHRLVMRRVADQVGSERRRDALQRAAAHVAMFMRSAVGRTRAQMEHVEGRRAHVEWLLRDLERVSDGSHPGELVEVANHLVRHLRHRGLHEHARGLCERVIETILAHSAHFPRSSWATTYDQLRTTGQLVRSVSNLALALRSLGQVRRAASLLEHAVAMLKIADDEHSPRVAGILSNLARLHLDVGEHDRALSIQTSIFALIEGHLGEESPTVAKILTNLAFILIKMGEPAEATLLCERALPIAERSCGQMHPNVAVVLTTLGQAARDMGQLQRAKDAMARALAIEEEEYGGWRPEVVAMTAAKLAAVQRDLGHPEAARTLLERALATIDETSLVAHGAVAAYLCDELVSVLRDLNDLDEAQRIFEKARALREPSDRERVVTDMTLFSNMTDSLLTGEPPEGILEPRDPVHKARIGLAIAELVFGARHRVVAIASGGVAAALECNWRFEEACPYREQSHSLLLKIHGAEHPDVAESALNLALVLLRLKEAPKARPLLKQSFAYFDKVRGPNDWEIARVLAEVGRELGILLRSPREALPILERVVSMLEELGRGGHPEMARNPDVLMDALDTLATVQMLAGDHDRARATQAWAAAVAKRL
jgi:tetratricopeptide (TPR) repeat protein